MRPLYRSRLPWLKQLLQGALAFAVVLCLTPTISAQNRPNILIISIEDLNDWTGSLAGHPQAQTPNIDALARRGTLFANAHCQAPICTPSRASLVSGLYPSTTGLYFLQPGLEAAELTKDKPTLLEHFAKAGYHTMGAGKFVKGSGEGQHFQEHGGDMGGFGPLPDEKLQDLDGLRLWDWGAFPEDESETPDVKIANWVSDKLEQEHEQSFLLVAGFWRPHVPMYAPPRFFKDFPLEGIQLPEVLENDRDDISEYAKILTIGHPAPRHKWFVESGSWKSAVQSYLASVAFVDYCVGLVLDALEASVHADNTIVVLFSDHGWQLGEKQHWAKRSLWNDSTRVPLIVSAPNFRPGVSPRPTGLIDIYPTLLELAGLPPKQELEGLSLIPLMKNPDAEWNRNILTTYTPNNHSLRSTNWHYIRYGDGSEELYDHRNDPHEWNNVAGELKNAQLLSNFREQLPKSNAIPIIGDWKQWEIESWHEAEANRGNP